MKAILLHEKARDAIRNFSKPVRVEIGELLVKLQLGLSIGMPLSRPMPAIDGGVHELRLKDSMGIYRVFYYVKSRKGILVFHAFTKKMQATPQKELETAKRRLAEMLYEE
jgi:phage-related protein